MHTLLASLISVTLNVPFQTNFVSSLPPRTSKFWVRPLDCSLSQFWISSFCTALNIWRAKSTLRCLTRSYQDCDGFFFLSFKVQSIFAIHIIKKWLHILCVMLYHKEINNSFSRKTIYFERLFLILCTILLLSIDACILIMSRY